MAWRIGHKIVHPLNPDWGVGEIVGVGDRQRALRVQFPGLPEVVTLSTERAVFKRFVFSPGAQARIRDEGTVVTVELRLDGPINPADFLRYCSPDGRIWDERQLEPVAPPAGPAERLARLEVDTLARFENRYAGMLLEQERQGQGLAGMLGGRIKLLPHQLYVAQRLSRRLPVRALLADEVGLGKTIEAGMIFAALRQAGRANRVLVLTPSSLAIQWVGEMYRKFHEVFTYLDGERLEDVQHDHEGLNPFDAHNRVIMGLDFFVNSGVADEAEELEGGWDLLIVDEAHHLKWTPEGGNASYQAVSRMVEVSRSVLFLTATPMELDRREYFALLRLLYPTLFHDEALFRQQLSEMGRASSLLLALENKDTLQPAEVPDKVAALFPRVARLRPLAQAVARGEAGANEALVDALTWLHPLGDVVVSNRRSRVGGFPERRVIRIDVELSEERRSIYADIRQLLGLLSQRVPASRREAFEGVAARSLRSSLGMLPSLLKDLKVMTKLPFAKDQLPLLADLCTRAEEGALLPDERLDVLVRLVRQAVEAGEKLLVFVESETSVLGLQTRLEARAQVRCAIFYEGLSPKERDLQVALFRNPEGYPVLISTEAGGEGRNFQFCHRLVHFDLPWDPGKLEQRIGRLDRIGQTHAVESVVLVARGTVEEEVVTLLDGVVGVFRETVGGLEPVLVDVGTDLRALALSSRGTDPEAWSELRSQVSERLVGARDAITAGLDHLLHRAGYDPTAGEVLTDALPEDFDERIEEFVLEFCEEVGITVHERDQPGVYGLELGNYFELEGLPGCATGDVYFGSFDRGEAVVREDIDFFATGHPLIEGIFSYLKDSEFGTVALRHFKVAAGKPALGVQFNFRMGSRSTEYADVAAFFPPRLTSVAVDFDGSLRPDLIPLLTERYSKADELPAENLENQREVLAEAVQRVLMVAEDEARRQFGEVVAQARQRFEAHCHQERRRDATYFEYQLSRVETLLEENPHDDNALLEAEILASEQEEREEWRAAMLDALSQGEPILDSAALYRVEVKRPVKPTTRR